MFYRIQLSKELGVIVWLEAPCGFKQPIVSWDHLGGLKQFADILLDFYNQQMEENGKSGAKKNDDEVNVISDMLLRQALGDSD